MNQHVSKQVSLKHVRLWIPFTSPYERIHSDRSPSDDNPTTNVQSNYHRCRASPTPSQIPIRIDFGAAGSQPSQQALLHAQAPEQRRQMFSASQNSASAALQAMRTSSN